MSREIKFRIWRAPDEYTKVSWMESWDSLLNYSMSDIFQLDNPDDVLEQFTGLKDKDGKDIYEDDVLENPKYRSVVKFGSGIFYADVIGAVNRFPLAGEWQTSVVIGNAHSNPELLEAAK